MALLFDLCSKPGAGFQALASPLPSTPPSTSDLDSFRATASGPVGVLGPHLPPAGAAFPDSKDTAGPPEQKLLGSLKVSGPPTLPLPPCLRECYVWGRKVDWGLRIRRDCPTAELSGN